MDYLHEIVIFLTKCFLRDSVIYYKKDYRLMGGATTGIKELMLF